MICKKCGHNIEDNSNFCGYCGNPVENDSVKVESGINTESVNIQSNESLEQQKNVEIDNIGQNNWRLSQVNDNSYKNIYDVNTLNTDNPVNQVDETKYNQPKQKKTNSFAFIIFGVILAAICVVLVYISFNKTSNNSITVLEKTLANFYKVSQNSGMVNAKISLSSDTGDNINLSASLKYMRNNDSYDFALSLDKNILTDRIDIYSKLNANQISLFAKSSVIDLLGLTKSDNDVWVYYNYLLDESMDELFEEDEDIDDDLEDLIDNDHFVYVDEVDNLHHYKFIIDNNLLTKLKEKENMLGNTDYSFDDIDTTLDQTIVIDFYITKSNELKRVSIDLTNLMDIDNISNAILTVEFSDLGSLTQIIPNEALSATIDFESYLDEYFNENNDYNDFSEYDDEYYYNQF